MGWFGRFGPKVFVETGTFLGNGVAEAIPDFDWIYSVEMDPEFAEKSRKRFGNEPKVTIIEGDSAVVLPSLCEEIRVPAVFYLDAHWSGWGAVTPLPLLAELRAISHRTLSDVVVIDDMRLMGQKKWAGDGRGWPIAEFDFREATMDAITNACPGRQEMAPDIDRLVIYR